jgi:hypothetical protein
MRDQNRRIKAGGLEPFGRRPLLSEATGTRKIAAVHYTHHHDWIAIATHACAAASTTDCQGASGGGGAHGQDSGAGR